MGRKEERFVKIPSYFRCPMSLEVMKSPLSLCTSVTYDRVSIQRWLDSGNTTCPASQQNLPSTNLVPNLTLQHLIHLWSSSSSTAATVPHLHYGNDLLRALRSSAADLVPDQGSCSDLNLRFYRREQHKDCDIHPDFGPPQIVYALVSVLKQGSSLKSLIDVAKVLESIPGLPKVVEAKMVIAEKEEVIAELIRLIGPSNDKGTMDRRAVEAGLGYLARIAEVRRSRSRIAQLGVVPTVTRLLAAKMEVVPPSAVEREMKVMEAPAGCTEERAAICEATEESMGAVAGRMMKAGKEGVEAVVAVLWIVCHYF